LARKVSSGSCYRAVKAAVAASMVISGDISGMRHAKERAPLGAREYSIVTSACGCGQTWNAQQQKTRDMRGFFIG
jgi:hypothetical protein